VADVPDGIVLRRHRDIAGIRSHWWRRAFLTLIAAFVLVGLLNVFGQRPEGSRAEAPSATLSVFAPKAVRGGLLWEARFHVTARQDLKKATLVLDSGWAEGMQINTIEPSPIGEASRDGKLAFELGHIAAGHSFVLYVEFQVNSTNVGRRSQTVRLDDGDTPILTVHRTVTVFP
jgi:hypothetical protein